MGSRQLQCSTKKRIYLHIDTYYLKPYRRVTCISCFVWYLCKAAEITQKILGDLIHLNVAPGVFLEAGDSNKNKPQFSPRGELIF